jgi:hypothetical protein
VSKKTKKSSKPKKPKDYALVGPSPVEPEEQTEAETASTWVTRTGLVERWRDDTVKPSEVVRPEFRAALLAVPVFYPAKRGDGLNTWYNALPKPTTVAESDLLAELRRKIDAGEPKPEEPEAEPSGKDVPARPSAPPAPAQEKFVTGLKNLMDEAGKALIEAPADPVLENGNGQPIIHFRDPVTGEEKVKGYTRVTTYIDGLDDKTVLTKWKMRTLLEGAAIDSGMEHLDDDKISTVRRAMHRLDESVQDIDRREKEEGELLELRRQELLKEHRSLLESIAEELMELGGAHEKANKGTNLHRLTEIVDNGGVLPDDTTASDRRDVEAYRAKMAELDLRVLWCERRVVLDDIQVSGTMDRAYQVRLPGMQRRIRVVGDLKTGRVDFGHGRIGMQLALYAKGLGYDWTKPLERERLSLSKAYGLLVHLPQGEGRCEVYVVDLELANQGLNLARQVREWRRDSRRVYDLKKPMVSES